MAWLKLDWSNSRGVDTSKGACLLYYIEVKTPGGRLYRYVGKTKRGASRLREYRRNVEKIERREPRRRTNGQRLYRPIHLLLAKAIELEWEYQFYPLENVCDDELLDAEKDRQRELGCFPEGTYRTWDVAQYEELEIEMLRK
jgi:hypothetical protein